MSPLLGFTKLFNELVTGRKLQTIRLPRKTPIREGDVLHIYWKLRTKECCKLGIAHAHNVKRKKVCELTELDAYRDGFDNLLELKNVLCKMHPKMTEITEVDVIRFVWAKKEFEEKEKEKDGKEKTVFQGIREFLEENPE